MKCRRLASIFWIEEFVILAATNTNERTQPAFDHISKPSGRAVIRTVCMLGMATALVDIHLQCLIGIKLVDAEQGEFSTVRMPRTLGGIWLD